MNNNNNNENNEKKKAEIEKKSAVPILAVGIVWLASVIVLGRIIRQPATLLTVTAILSFVVYNITKQLFPPKKMEITMQDRKIRKSGESEKKTPPSKLTPEERELKDLNERIDLYFIEIKLLNDSIGDEFISSELLQIENTLKKIQTQLSDDAQKSKEKKVEQLSQFFDYYMPTTIKILNSYKRIEKQHLTGNNATETKNRVEESLPFIRKAFEKELDNMFSEEMLDITTDIDVIEAMLSKDGLLEKNTINSMKDVKNDVKNDF